MRTGDEPAHARSPLRLRLVLAVMGLLCWGAGATVFAVRGTQLWALACAVGACLAVLNIAVVIARIQAGAHWQPGRTIPPYRPVDPLPDPVEHGRRPRREVPQPVRVRRYLILMGSSLTLLMVAWLWIWRVSMPAAETMSLLAMVLLPLAAAVANSRSGRVRTVREGPARAGRPSPRS